MCIHKCFSLYLQSLEYLPLIWRYCADVKRQLFRAGLPGVPLPLPYTPKLFQEAVYVLSAVLRGAQGLMECERGVCASLACAQLYKHTSAKQLLLCLSLSDSMLLPVSVCSIHNFSHTFLLFKFFFCILFCLLWHLFLLYCGGKKLRKIIVQFLSWHATSRCLQN